MSNYIIHKKNLAKLHSDIEFIEFGDVKPAKIFENIFYNPYVYVNLFILAMMICYIIIGVWFSSLHHYWLAVVPTLSMGMIDIIRLNRSDRFLAYYTIINLAIALASIFILPGFKFINPINVFGAGSTLVWTLGFYTSDNTSPVYHHVVAYVEKHPPVKLVGAILFGALAAAVTVLLVGRTPWVILTCFLSFICMLSMLSSVVLDDYYLERYLYVKHLERRVLNAGYVDVTVIQSPDNLLYYYTDYLSFMGHSNAYLIKSTSLNALLPTLELFNISYILYRHGSHINVRFLKEENEPTNPTRYVLKRGKACSLSLEDVIE